MKFLNDDNMARLDDLLHPFREINPQLPEIEANKIKFQNSALGVSPKAQLQINRFAHKVQRGKFDEVSTTVKLKLIDLFSLYANHIDQQTSEKENRKLSIKDKETTALLWIEAANHLCETLVPDLSQSIAEKNCSFDTELLSSLSMTLHYLGKMRRYNPSIHIEDRLPLLQYAVSISKHLAPLKEQKDRHYFSDRTSTFEAPVIITLRQLKRFDEAMALVQTQLNDSIARGANFHIIQGKTLLSEIAREDERLEDAIRYGNDAINFVLDSASRSEEDFTHHSIFFNARVALMNSLEAIGNHKEAACMAQAILNEYEANPNCGAKESYHIVEARKIVNAGFSSTLSY